MAIATIQPGQIKTGPGRIYYAPLGTTIPTFTASASKLTGTWTSFLEVGATDEGLTYSESTDTEDVRVAESLYAIRTQTTGKTGSVAFAMSHISDLNWKLASNGGTIVSTGSAATKMNTYVPPLAGSEVRVMLGFQSLDDDEILIWPQVFNTEGFETARSGFADKHVLPVTFSVELPDPAVLTTPYKRWTSGNLAQSV
jgi:hypothetical protein